VPGPSSGRSRQCTSTTTRRQPDTQWLRYEKCVTVLSSRPSSNRSVFNTGASPNSQPCCSKPVSACHRDRRLPRRLPPDPKRRLEFQRLSVLSRGSNKAANRRPSRGTNCGTPPVHRDPKVRLSRSWRHRASPSSCMSSNSGASLRTSRSGDRYIARRFSASWRLHAGGCIPCNSTCKTALAVISKAGMSEEVPARSRCRRTGNDHGTLPRLDQSRTSHTGGSIGPTAWRGAKRVSARDVARLAEVTTTTSSTSSATV